MLIYLYQVSKHSFVELQLSNISVQSKLERKLLIPAQFIYFDLKGRDMLAEGGLIYTFIRQINDRNESCIQHEAKREMITCTEGVANR